jgi:Ser/Thr protein kinase RdoA (MazF antagonist)
MTPMDNERERQVAAALRFSGPKAELRIERLGEGNINDTYLVEGAGPAFVLQRINRRVFPRPELVVENFATVTAHLGRRDRSLCPYWQDIRLVSAIDGRPFYKDEHGDVWRAQTYIDGTATFSIIDTPERAREVGWTVGTFHHLVADLPSASLHETLPGFHLLAAYLDHFDRVNRLRPVRQSIELRHCIDIVERYRLRMHSVKQAEDDGRLIPQIIHGDPKAANVLFDRGSSRAVCLIDLDTVRPGLLLYDIGDCLRSCCNPAGEEGDPDAVRFDVDLAREILAGYYAGAGHLITPLDKDLVFDAVCLLCFELGLRFLTDYLEGNRYFRIENDGDNLQRALHQFHLLLDLITKGNILH